MTDKMPDISILQRIQKLLAKADNLKQLGNEAEAMAFLDGANKLLIKHKLELTDVQLALRNKEDPVKMHYVNPSAIGLRSKKTRIAWEEALVLATADAYFCRVLLIPGSNHFWLVGRREDRQVAEFMITTLVRFAEQEADRTYVKYFYHCKNELGDVTLARGFRPNFLLAFTNRVIGRFKTEFQQQVQEGGQFALVRLQQEKQAAADFVECLKTKGHVDNKITKPNIKVTANRAGFEAGHEAGGRANLRAKVVQQQTPNKTRLLTDGQDSD